MDSELNAQGRALHVDNRYSGDHGIARYSAEVVPRLTTNWQPLLGEYRPGKARDVLNRHRAGLPPTAVLYNPGYSAGVARCSQLLTVHDLIHLRDGNKLVHLYYERIVKPAIFSAGSVCTVSEASAADIREWLGSDDIRIWNTSNGCSGAFRPVGPAESSDVPYFLFVGNLKQHKNPRLFLEAMKAFPDHSAVLVTSDHDRARVLLQNEPRQAVRILSGVTDERLAALYRGAAALIFPSKREGFGLPALEALQCGTKVVFHRGAAPVLEICGPTQYGFDDADSVDDLVDAMERALSSDFVPPQGIDRYRWPTVAGVVNDAVRELIDG